MKIFVGKQPKDPSLRVWYYLFQTSSNPAYMSEFWSAADIFHDQAQLRVVQAGWSWM